MTEFAKLIRVRSGGLEIDGVEFPWYVSAEGITARAGRTELTTVTVSIPCERVEVDEQHGVGGDPQ